MCQGGRGGVTGRTGRGDAASRPQHGMVGNVRAEVAVGGRGRASEGGREIESEAGVSLSSPAPGLSEMRWRGERCV